MRTSMRPTPVNILGEMRENLRHGIAESAGNSNMKTWDLYIAEIKYNKIDKSKIKLVHNESGDLLANSKNTSLKWKSYFCESFASGRMIYM